MSKEVEGNSRIPTCDDYFETIQSRKMLPSSLQESLTAAFAQIQVSSFPEVPSGKVIEIPSDASILDAVQILSTNNILAAPVRNAEVGSCNDWKGKYLGIIDYSAIVLWVLENAELAAFALSAGSATAAALGTGAVGGLGAIAVGATGPVAIAGMTVAAAGAALAGGIAAEKSIGRDAATAANHIGEQFYRLLIQEEPFKSTTVKSVVEMYRWAPFLPVASDSSMLTVLLLLSKYRLRNVPVIDIEKFYINNFITQSAVVQGLKQCKGRDWFDCIAARPLSDLGLPFMSYDEVISIKSEELILEAFKRMKDNRIGGLPVIEEPNRKIVGSLSIQDIRFLLLRPELFTGFRQLAVKDFIEAVDSASSPLTCTSDALLGSVIDSLASRRVHRVYVVKGDEVVGVVTLRDVISCFIYEPPGYFERIRAEADENDGAVWVIRNARFAVFCILISMCFGVDLDEETIVSIDTVMKKVLITLTPRMDDFLPLLKPFFSKQRAHVLDVRREQIETIVPVIRKRRAILKSPSEHQASVQFSYLDSLLNFRVEGRKSAPNDTELVSLCSEFLNGGTDTTATAIEWGIVRLIEKPSIQSKLYDEINSAVGLGRAVDEKDVEGMTYLQAFVKELLRKHPPTYFSLTHAAVQTTKLGDYDIPADANLEIYHPMISEDPRLWSKPDDFEPERFISGGESVDMTGVTAVKMIPFGAGRRICPGLGLGTMHITLMMARMVQAFEWRAHADEPKLDFGSKLEFTVVKTRPLRAMVRPRKM